MKSIEKVDVSSNSITSLHINNNKILKEVNVSGNSITDASVGICPKLDSLITHVYGYLTEDENEEIDYENSRYVNWKVDLVNR